MRITIRQPNFSMNKGMNSAAITDEPKATAKELVPVKTNELSNKRLVRNWGL